MTLIDQRGQDFFDSAQLHNPLPNHGQLPGAKLLRLAAVPAVFERQQISHLLEVEAQRLGLSDEPQPPSVRRRVVADTAERPIRLSDQTAALVVTDGFHMDAGVLRQGPDGELLGHLDSVVDYGLKVTPTSETATRDV